ncbi:hypothetical protein L1D50_23135, partial [Pseudoalteromonas sp. Isolate6]
SMAICLGLSLGLSAGNAFAGQESEAASIGEQILDKAKDKFVKAAGGQISSLLIDAFFGSSGPSYVNLSEESLQAIQERVHKELVGVAEYEYISDLESIQLSMRYFNDTARNNTPDIGVLGSLLVDSDRLITHQALNSQFNEQYFYMADTLALASSINLSIYVERHLQGFINKNAVRARAHYLANRLENFLVAKKRADLPLEEECERVNDQSDLYDHIVCKLIDPHGNSQARADLYKSDYGDYYDEEKREWESKMQQTRAIYYSDRFSEIEDVISKLRNF